MQWNKKSASLLAVLSLLLGSAGAIVLQARAQQSSTPTPPAQIQTQSAAIGEQENSATDKDNIQDEKDNGQPESALEQENGKEAKGGIEADENLPGGGHQDQDGVNVDHQFEGVE
jgi:cytoskeletal protein RodZ